MNDGSSRKPSLYWAHPLWLLLPFGLGAIGMWKSITIGYPPEELMTSLLGGFCTGLPIALWAKWSLRKHKDSEVEFALLPSAEQLQKKCGLWYVVFMLLILFGTRVIEDRLHIPWMPGLSLWLVFPMLCYPEQKAIYEAAKARLREQSDAD